MNTDEKFMKEAIRLSESAVSKGNEPFGAVLVKNGKIVYASENKIFTENDRTYHAELGLIKNFTAETGITDLSEYTLYSSCEPCFMCSGAMVWANLGRLVYAASDIDLCEIIGENGSECSKIVFENSFRKPETTSGVLRKESMEILKKYFSHKEKN